MVSLFQISFSKELGSLELVKEVINSGDRVSILDYDFVKGFVIDTESPYPIFLLHHHDWTSARRRAWPNVSFLE